MVLFSQYLKDIPFFYPTYKKDKGLAWSRVYLIRMFPVLLTIIIMWAVCAILTATDTFEIDDGARTDLNIEIIERIDWIKLPYPCM